MISIRKQIQDADHFAPRFEALRNAHLALTASSPEAALPANPELAAHCRRALDQAALAVNLETSAKDLDQAGKVAVTQLDAICRSNIEAIEQRDSALKEVVGTVAEVINGFKGHGERHNSKMEQIALEFEALSRLEDVDEIRRRLCEDVARLKESVQEMRREGEESVRHFETLVVSFQQRLEAARKESRFDRLTGLGDRRDAEHNLLMLLTAAGCNYFMGVPCSDDVMLSYQSTSYHDAVAMRQLFGLRPAPEFANWLEHHGLPREA